jgi:hypothetical protein
MSSAGLDDIGKRFRTDKSSLGHDYLRHYEWFFGPFKDGSFTLVEIGAKAGASLRMWSEYFPRARIVCIEIEPEAKRLEIDRVSLEIGDSGSAAFLSAFREKHQRARIVLDDGSHRWDHQRIAFKSLFPMVEPGGYYVVEDVHTSYEEGFSGEDDMPFLDFLRPFVQYLNLRGEKRQAFEAIYSRDVVEIARHIDFVCFIARSCVIRKRVQPARDRAVLRSPL